MMHLLSLSGSPSSLGVLLAGEYKYGMQAWTGQQEWLGGRGAVAEKLSWGLLQICGHLLAEATAHSRGRLQLQAKPPG